MSTNPNNSVGTNGAYGGRTSVNALNDNLAAYSRGILSGWVCSPNSGLTVSLGGDGTTRDVAIAEDNAGNKTTINNISGSPIDVTLSAAPASNSRIDLVVAYVDNPPQGTNTETDNPGACGIIAVSGNVALSPTAPDDNAIRTAITADGASGTTAYYVVLASINIASGTTDLTTSNISNGNYASIGSNNIDFSTFADYSLSEIDTGAKWVDGKNIYKKTIYQSSVPVGNNTISHNISNLGLCIKVEGFEVSAANSTLSIPSLGGLDSLSDNFASFWVVDTTEVKLFTSLALTDVYITLYYTKS